MDNLFVNDLTRDMIVEGLRDLGLRPGDLLLAHSSYKSFAAPIVGGPRAVALALIDAVSPGGSVFVPTFNYGRLPFDPATTPSLDGAVSEAFRQLPGVTRSPHPTHPLAGIGPDAPKILRHHDPTKGVFAIGSPFWRLYQRDATILLIGCGHESNSMIHVAEEMVHVPYLTRTRPARIVRPDGTINEITVRRPGCSNGFPAAFDAPLRARQVIPETRLAAARLMLLRASDVVRTAADLLMKNPAALLCPPGCRTCDEARGMVDRHEPQSRARL